MNTAILQKELLLLLRQKRVFVLAGLLYSLLVLGVALRWGDVSVSVNRAQYSQDIFYILLGLGYFVFFTFHAVQASARIMACEKERGTATLLRVSPLSPTSIIFQKLLTPLSIEWLLFLGTLPFLSLVFVLGGVPPLEFIYQLINLTVWLNTVILVGLFVGARGRDTAQSIRIAWGLILGIGVLLPWSVSFLVVGLMLMSKTGELDIPDSLMTILDGLGTLSPLGMVSSYDHHLVSASPIHQWPIFPSWVAHLSIQFGLFLGAIRNWKRLASDRLPSLNRSEVTGFSGFFRWLKRGRRVHGPYSTGWRSFHDREEREVYRQWKPSRLTGVLLVLLAGPFLAFGGFPVQVGWVTLVGITLAVVTVGFSSNSLKKEINQGTSIFLLTSPIPPSDMILGKWVFYMRQGFWVCVIGLLGIAVGFGINLVGSGFIIGETSVVANLWLLAGCLVLLCFVPFLSILRLADNVRLYPQVMPYLALFGLLCCAPLGLMVISALVGAGLVDASNKAYIRSTWAKVPSTLVGWLCFASCIFNFFLLPIVPAPEIFGPYFYFGMIFLDLCILPPATGFYLWTLFLEKSDGWWREHFLPTL